MSTLMAAAPEQVQRNETHTVLLVEDSIEIAAMYRLGLSTRGFQALVATTGLDGAKAALQHRPAMIVLDYRLPDVSGSTCSDSCAGRRRQRESRS